VLNGPGKTKQRGAGGTYRGGLVGGGGISEREEGLSFCRLWEVGSYDYM